MHPVNVRRWMRRWVRLKPVYALRRNYTVL
jgi:hypothetical protein